MALRLPAGYSTHEWRIAAILFASYFATFGLGSRLIPTGAMLYPSSAIALTALFFGGLRLWPVVFLAALIGSILGGFSTAFSFVFPIGETLQAVAAAFLLRDLRLDPLFRRHRDTFLFIFTVLIVSILMPTLASFGNWIGMSFYGIGLSGWEHAYMATVSGLLLVAPFLLRWSAKTRFTRRPSQVLETLAVFMLLLVMDYAFFVGGVMTVLDIPLSYLLLVPLFWIALRLRPRFVSLAILLTSIFAVSHALVSASPEAFPELLFQTEVLLITFAVIFYIVVSLEEDRRVNLNAMRSQVSTLEHAVTQVNSESKAKNDFIAILAHELRNPLAPIQSGIDLLRLQAEKEGAETGTLRIMEERMRAVSRLLEDLLDISRVSEGKVTLERKRVDLKEILERAILSTEHHRAELGQRLVFRAPKKAVPVVGDALRLEQIFSNLLTNASKFSNSGDEIALSLISRNGFAEVVVTDSGVGISPETLETIFVPFRQVELGDRTQKGLGIGLALVRSFAELHGGSVEAKSRGVGKGSRFTVRIPLSPALPHRETRAQVFWHRKAVGPLVLVADDNDAAAGALGRLLEILGSRVAYAYNGLSTIETAFESRPDAVLLDIALPDMDGYEVAKVLRERGFAGRIVGISGYGSQDAGQEASAAFDDWLTKPAGLRELRRILPELRDPRQIGNSDV